MQTTPISSLFFENILCCHFFSVILHTKGINIRATILLAHNTQQKLNTIMCTYNLSLSDSAVDRIRPAFKDDAAIQVWLQQQLEMLVMQFSVPPKQEKPMLSQRLRGIAKNVPMDFDYKKELESRF